MPFSRKWPVRWISADRAFAIHATPDAVDGRKVIAPVFTPGPLLAAEMRLVRGQPDRA